MQKLVTAIINRSNWWHVPPKDKNAYSKRGKFLASTYLQAEFYGLPNLEPEQVYIRNPLFGFSEPEILCALFRGDELQRVLNINLTLHEEGLDYKTRIGLDAEIHKKAKQLGYDAIVLMTESGMAALQRGKKPNSIELNVICNNGGKPLTRLKKTSITQPA